MKFTVKLIDIGTREVLLNIEDARSINALAGDRVQILNETTGVSVAAFVSTTTTLIQQGVVGIYRVTNEKLVVEDGDQVEVRLADRPSSLQFIKKKMDGERLTKDETLAVIRDVVNHDITPAELTAYVTACYINALDIAEVEHLTRAMVETGEQITFHTHPIVDKHSIGGVPGNKISLLVVPIIAASGLKIPKTSSRAITGAGGTADLMEVLAPVEFSAEEVQKMTLKAGGTIVWGGATNIAPADDRIIIQEYPFKIDARGQMIASVMAKKYAVGADLVVIDIPVGEGTKILNVQEGRKLAREFIEIGERLNMRVECALTYGDSPVGRSIGPKLEVREALRILEGEVEPGSLFQKSAAIAGIALEMSGKAARGMGGQMAADILKSGKALEKFLEIIEIQGGDPSVKSEDIVPGKYKFVVNAPASGYVVGMNNPALISMARNAGAPHDRGAGLLLHAKKGNRVEKGEPIFTIYAERSWRLEKAIEEGRRLMPVLVEGMLLDRVPHEIKWV
ncbi:MAG TPA: AMP phosphorylase [Methanoregulaceae archaeon]|nr:MAG: AMP phosphorylase [Methanolinea sp.]HON81596.1 AMP phosphorylase [Methanoregulaceae archaeon]HPD10403.1 AMP phosphorylase [Methanoregulaceae archaeon]HRT15345.1 AMP phosphorylase [Methanoregulaceae archaeon]HRU30995.1 AMP phosphorylase [Methanoregulaceae archaeon]